LVQTRWPVSITERERERERELVHETYSGVLRLIPASQHWHDSSSSNSNSTHTHTHHEDDQYS